MHLYIKDENRQGRCWVIAVGTVSTNSQLHQQPPSAKRPFSRLATRLVMMRVDVGIILWLAQRRGKEPARIHRGVTSGDDS
jgi:hypothetical protein